MLVKICCQYFIFLEQMRDTYSNSSHSVSFVKTNRKCIVCMAKKRFSVVVQQTGCTVYNAF